jgi:hypothetical protein
LTSVDAAGHETVLTEGGTIAALGKRARIVSIKLISTGNLLRRGTKLRVYLGGTSTVQNVANLLYLKLVPDESQLTVGKVALTLPLLPKTISK